MQVESGHLVLGEASALTVALRVTCMLSNCPGAATSTTLGSPVHFNLLLKVSGFDTALKTNCVAVFDGRFCLE